MNKKTWYKLDNIGTFYAFSKDSKIPAVFRYSAELNEMIEEAILTRALDKTIKNFPHFNVVLKRGFFWYYLERVKKVPKVHLECEKICANIYIDSDNVLYRVSYFNKRINFEISHILSDGRGAALFLKELLINYISMKYDIKGFDLYNSSSLDEKAENSFDKNYEKGNIRLPKFNRVYKYHKKKRKYSNFMEYHVSVSKIKKLAKEKNATITTYLLAVYLLAFKEEMKRKDFKKYIKIDIPIDLREFYNSSTTRNYISFISIFYKFKDKNEEFDTILSNVKELFYKELNKDLLDKKVNNLVYLEKSIATRFIPLFIKNIVLNIATFINSSTCTAVLSNVGTFKIPDIMKNHIKNINVLSPTDKIKLTMISYEDDLSIGINSIYESNNIIKNFVRFLASNNISGILNTVEDEDEDL